MLDIFKNILYNKFPQAAASVALRRRLVMFKRLIGIVALLAIASTMSPALPAMAAQGGDSDTDGLTDEVEQSLADTFVPYLYFAEDEDANQAEILRFYQVTPIYKTSPNVWNYPQYEFPEYQGPEGILLTFTIAYSYDYGDAIAGLVDHPGDTEVIRIFLVHPRNQPEVWDPFVLIIKRHYDDPERYFSEDFSWSGTHPIVWVSEDKHAMYSSWEECDDYSEYLIEFEFCGGGYAIDYPITLGVDGFNVGERRDPENISVYDNEFAWGDPDYCGGWVTINECGGGLDSKWWPLPDPDGYGNLVWRLASYTNDSYIRRWGAEYQVCFYTGDVDHGGTDMFVDITLQGSTHSQSFYDLDNGDDNFEKGDEDCFGLGTYALPEDLVGLSLNPWLFVAEDDSEWFLEKVTVQENFTGQFWEFPCNCWIDAGQYGQYDDDIGQSSYQPPIFLQPAY